GSLLEIRMLTALALDAQGERLRAIAQLAGAFLLAPEPESSLRLFLDEGAPMVELLRAAERHPAMGQHARRLLASTTASATKAAPESPHGASTPLSDALSERELQVLSLLGSDLSGPDI